VMLGASALIHVDGEWDDDLMKQLKAPNPKPAVEGGH